MALRGKRSEISADSTTRPVDGDGDVGSARASTAARGRGGTRAGEEPHQGTSEPASGEGALAGASELGVDALLDELERVVTDLEEGDLPLEAALARFEAGVRLARRGGALLDALEQRVDVLLAGRIEPARFDSDDDETND